MTTTDLAGLIERLESASEGSRTLDIEIGKAAAIIPASARPVFDEAGYLVGFWIGADTWEPDDELPWYTRSIDAALTLVPEGWWWSAGLCGLSGHVTIGPDYNGPHRERLLREFPEDKWHEGVSVDLEPGDGIHRTCLAICAAVLKARAALGSQS